MYRNNEKLATTLYEILDDLILTDDDKEVSIDKLLNPNQKYDLIMSIVGKLPPSDFEYVINFNKEIKAQKEKTHIVNDFITKDLNFTLFLEEILILGKALNFTNKEIYDRFIVIFDKITNKAIKPDLTQITGSLTNLLFIVYGSFYSFNLIEIQNEILQEVYYSNTTKLISNNEHSIEIIKTSVKLLKEKGFNVRSIDLKNNYLIVIDNDNKKILKPVSYVKPNLKKIINKYFKTI